MNSASLLPVLEVPEAHTRQAFADFWGRGYSPSGWGSFFEWGAGWSGIDHDLWFLGSPYRRLGPSHSAASSCLESSYG